eukprot:scaffold33473_cov119-Isochrysis_galbana.AAC.1
MAWSMDVTPKLVPVIRCQVRKHKEQARRSEKQLLGKRLACSFTLYENLDVFRDDTREKDGTFRQSSPQASDCENRMSPRPPLLRKRSSSAVCCPVAEKPCAVVLHGQFEFAHAHIIALLQRLTKAEAEVLARDALLEGAVLGTHPQSKGLCRLSISALRELRPFVREAVKPPGVRPYAS